MEYTKNDIAKMIDHTLLKPNATKTDIERLCAEGAEYGFASVCVNPVWTVFVADRLCGSDVKVCTVIGFPLGANETQIKAQEAGFAVSQGAGEVDMVINIGAALDENYELVEADIQAVVQSARKSAAETGRFVTVKVILETCFFSDSQIEQLCLCAKRAGADFVKTSTGFASGGADERHVALMRKTVGTEMGVKASGGIRTADDARRMIQAGANRLGTSSGAAIINGWV